MAAKPASSSFLTSTPWISAPICGPRRRTSIIATSSCRGPNEPSRTGSLERGHHLVRQELEASRLELGRNAAARIQLRHDAVEPQLFPELAEPIDHARRGAEHHFLGEDVVVGQIGHALGLEAPSIGGTRAGAGNPPAPPPGLGGEKSREGLPRLFPGAFGGGGGGKGGVGNKPGSPP